MLQRALEQCTCSQTGVCLDSRLQLAGMRSAAKEPNTTPTRTMALLVAKHIMTCSTARESAPAMHSQIRK